MDLTEAAADAVDAETRDSSLDGIDAGVQIKMGAASLYLGYLFTDVGSGKWKAPTTLEYVDDVLAGSLYKRELFRQALDEMDWRKNGSLNILCSKR